MRNRRKVISILIICGLPTLLSASSWFNFFTDVGEDETISHDMVSPIVNREVEASVLAHNWPFIVDNIYCEAWSYHRHENWEFMDHLVKLLSEGGGDKGSFQEAMELVLKSSNKKDSALLQYSLSLRAHSPLCELHRTLARSHTLLQPEKLSAAEAFYVIPGEQDFIGVTVEELLKLLDMAVDQSGKTEEDLLLPDEVARNAGGNRKDSPLIIVYANMGSDAFGKLYQVLVEKQARFVVRHRGNVLYEENGGASTALQGYGVRLDIRNVEYRVFDDRSSSLDGNEASLLNSSSLESLTNHTLAGIKLSELDMSAEEKLKLQSELWKLHEAQQIHSQLVPPKWQRRKLSLQAATVISQSQSDVLFTLQDVSQNLPSVASTLVHVPVPEDLVELVDLMEPIMRQTSGVALTINGRRVPVGRPSFNVFDLLKMMREEQELLDGMSSKLSPFLPFKGIQQVQKVWSLGEGHFLGTEGQDSGDYDENEDDPGVSGTVRRIDVGRKWKGAVLYVNDVEKDQMYMNWPRSVQQAIMAMQFGSPPTVRRNIFTVLSVLDPIEGKTAEHAGLGLGSQLMQASYPVRLGYLIVNAKDLKQCKTWIRDNGISDPDQPCPTDRVFDTKVTNIDQLQKIPASTHAIHRLIAKMNEEYSGQPLLPSFADYFLQRIDTFTSDDGSLTMGDMVRTFGEIMQQLDGMNPNSAIKFAIDALNDVDNVGKSTYGKALRFALNRAVTPGMGFLNGRQISIDNDPGKVFMEEQNHIFGLIMKGKITDAKPKSIYGSLLAGDGVFPRLHPLLNEVDDAHVDLDHGLSSDALLIPKNVVVGVGDVPDAVFVVEAVVNMKSKDDVDFVANFISIMDACPNTLQDGSSTANVLIGYRILCAPSDSTPALCSILSNAGLVGVDRTKLIVSEDGILEKSTNDILDLITDLDDEVRETISSFAYANSWARDKTMPIGNFVSVNGKSYAPEEGTLSEEDIELLLSMEISRSKATTKMLSDHLVFAKSEKNFFDAIAKTSIFLARQFSKSEKGKGKRMDMVNEAIELEKAEKLEANPFRFSWNMDNFEELKIQVSVALDPATEDAQRVAPFLIAFRDVLKLPLQMILVPKALTGDDKSVPITSYYRFVADPNAMPDVNPPKASFSNLPTNHILTLRMDVPESWNVQQTSSIQDTDNLRCDIKMGCGDDAHGGTTDPSIMTHDKRQITRVEYGLKNLLIFGQCYDATQKSPPNGLQLTLSREKNKGVQLQAAAEVSPDGTLQVSYPSISEDTHYSDTLVMKTVGYWQLRANPGIWQLQIASGSRGADIFDMVDGSIENGRMKLSKKQVNNATKIIYVKDFTANEDARVLMVKRRPGWEKASLFDEDKRSTKSNDDEVIHVFSLATGHLYERFLKIMMLSVTKRTSMKVKFWLFENFLSPTFKASAETMATRIGCEVEFVTYKWPEFLRGQSEKQRIIWGYKILFLDVLFPLNVKKIIYVDADQVVRGDLKELWEMDLKGAPYGYTPMCSSRESTLGFQFWNSGFWETHLRGKPYHISALYVVDLEKFRKDLVGDNLRSTYQQLSADPHSLANLDQDLPNYAQHQVPIFSLPQEWLWCESWCSDESKAAAKTIDLCNNPLHKEPKVSMAKRIISGDLFQESWIELDAEVETYEKEYFESQSTK